MKPWVIGVAGLAVALIAFLLMSPREDSGESDSLLQRDRQVSLNAPSTPMPSPEVDLPRVTAEKDQPSLDEDKQKHLWDLAHHTFELEWKFGKLVKQALKDHDQSALPA